LSDLRRSHHVMASLYGTPTSARIASSDGRSGSIAVLLRQITEPGEILPIESAVSSSKSAAFCADVELGIWTSCAAVSVTLKIMRKMQPSAETKSAKCGLAFLPRLALASNDAFVNVPLAVCLHQRPRRDLQLSITNTKALTTSM
jgi:hypothetical protein